MTDLKFSSQPPMSYRIRESQRAKNVSLRVSWQNGLEVTIPPGFNLSQLPEILRKKQAWIEKATQRVEEQRKLLEAEPPNALPERLTLRAIDEEWHVEYCPTPADRVTLVEKPGLRLVISGSVETSDRVKAVLQKWLAYKAQLHLSPWLKGVSQRCKLPFNNMSVRGQKTRWGSCSRQKNISLNYKLLFVPHDLVHYVLVHELCHTVHLNHSSKFWALVEKKQANYKRLDRELRDALRYVPSWLE